MIAGFSLLDQTYKDKTLSEAQKQKEQEEKQNLADNAAQLNVSVTRKQMTIVGWSPNLLQNSSGQVWYKGVGGGGQSYNYKSTEFK